MPLQWTAAQDVTKRWVGDDPIPATTEQIETFLEDAEDTILREFPDVAERLVATPPTLTQARVQKVAARMVVRFLRNPEGLRTDTETNGPFSQNTTSAIGRPGEIYLSDEDRADLTPDTGSGRAFTIDTSPPSYVTGPDLWLSLGRTYL